MNRLFPFQHSASIYLQPFNLNLNTSYIQHLTIHHHVFFSTIATTYSHILRAIGLQDKLIITFMVSSSWLIFPWHVNFSSYITSSSHHYKTLSVRKEREKVRSKSVFIHLLTLPFNSNHKQTSISDFMKEIVCTSFALTGICWDCNLFKHMKTEKVWLTSVSIELKIWIKWSL